MDKSAVRRIVTRDFKALRRRLYLNSWTITIEYGTIQGNPDECLLGMCWADPKYRSARIRLDPEQLEDEEAVQNVLRHEMLHILHAELEVVRQAVLPMLPSGGPTESIERMFTFAVERIVGNIEGMLDAGLKLDLMLAPKKKKRKRKGGRR